MPSRLDFKDVKALNCGKVGGNNLAIHLVVLKSTGKKYIEKRVDIAAIQSGYGERQVKIMYQCWGHPNKFRNKASDLDYRRLGYGSIFMQNCELGSLDGLIKRYAAHKERFPDEGFLWKVFWDVSLAVNYLLTGADVKTARKCATERKPVPGVRGWNPIAHMNIKPANIFMSNEDYLGADKTLFPLLILGDFGCSKTYLDIINGKAAKDTHSG